MCLPMKLSKIVFSACDRKWIYFGYARKLNLSFVKHIYILYGDTSRSINTIRNSFYILPTADMVMVRSVVLCNKFNAVDVCTKYINKAQDFIIIIM
jgi:hypothetical protein